jgi:hypothetical protein
MFSVTESIMRKLALAASILLFATTSFAQQAKKTSDASQSTIQGCVMGSAVTSSYALTDEHTGEIYLLRGNDSLLKQNVGHEVLISGSATAIRPSDKKGSIGYISPSEPHRTATSAYAGQNALNFEVTHIQPVADTCAQQSESQKAAIAASQAALGTVDNNSTATEPRVGYSAQGPQSKPGQNSGSDASSVPPLPAAGKTGNNGDTHGVSTTASAGQVTPGFQTEAGKAQAPGKQTDVDQNLGSHQQPNAAPGAPPNQEQTAQNPAAAERIASSAQRAEINNSQHQLGVNAQPNYQQSAQQQTERANQPVAEQKAQTGLPGASQHTTGGQRERQQQAEEHHKAEPTLVGCLSQSDKSGKEFFLKEQNSGTRYRLSASPQELKDHLNHLVEVVGKPIQDKETAQAVAGNSEPAFDVTGIRDLAPTCGAAR